MTDPSSFVTNTTQKTTVVETQNIITHEQLPKKKSKKIRDIEKYGYTRETIDGVRKSVDMFLLQEVTKKMGSDASR